MTVDIIKIRQNFQREETKFNCFLTRVVQNIERVMKSADEVFKKLKEMNEIFNELHNGCAEITQYCSTLKTNLEMLSKHQAKLREPKHPIGSLRVKYLDPRGKKKEKTVDELTAMTLMSLSVKEHQKSMGSLCAKADEYHTLFVHILGPINEAAIRANPATSLDDVD